MTNTTAALLARICEAKGIDLDAKLKKDVDTVLGLITDELVEEGVAGKLAALEKRYTDINTRYREAVNDLAKRLTAANSKMNELADAVEMQRRAVESLVGREGRRYMLPDRFERAQAARDLYAGMLEDSMHSLDDDIRRDPVIIANCIEAASLVAWRYIDGPRPPVNPEDKAKDFPGLRVKPDYKRPERRP